MNNFEDEIIDLNDEDVAEEIPVIEENSINEEIQKTIETPPINNQPINNYSETNNKQSNNSFPNKKNIFKNNTNDDQTSKRLQGLGNKNRIFPLNNISSNTSETEEKSTQTNFETKTTAIAKNVVSGKSADKTAELIALFTKKDVLKFKIIAVAAVVIIFLFLLLIIVASQSETETFGRDTYTYTTGDIEEEELLEQMEYYEYCDDEDDCKEKGIYSFYTKLKEVYDRYNQACGDNVQVNQPCGIKLNTALIIETMNYYQNSEEEFFDYDDEEDANQEFSLFGFFSEFFQKFQKQIQIQKLIADIEKIALAQAEYVEETCVQNEQTVTLKYYQISFNKYISYLKYGGTSTHPNYTGQPLIKENDTCEYAKNDYITTSYSNSNEIEGSTIGEKIANFALQFVGNPYVWGGTSLTEGADCSGFTMKVMENFGISIPRHSTSQLNGEGGTIIGTDVSNALPGDIIVYAENNNGVGHVAIYIGNNSIVHAASTKAGIKITENASYREILGIVRYWK